MPEDTVSIRIRLRDSLKFKHDADRSARAVDNIGDKASKTARRLARMNAASSKTRVNFGPFSTSMRGGALAVGALTLATGKAVPFLLSTAEAVATLTGGAGAAGGVGLLALAQGAGVAKLGLGDLSDALGGNATALKRLTPEARALFETLNSEKTGLRSSAQAGLLPGLAKGAEAAHANFGKLNRVVRLTGSTLGGVGKDAGTLLGSAGVGADITTVGRSNAKIIDNVGHAGLNVADAFRHVVVEASPLARWLSRMVLDGSDLVDVWASNARQSGRMAKFFREARTDLRLLGSATGHTGRGLTNLFGSPDVDGTKTLRSLDQITRRFERWSRSPAVRKSAGDAIVAEIPQAVGAVMTAIANNLPAAGGTAAKVFLDGFMHADVWGKLLAGGFLAKKLGLLKLGKNIAGGAGGGGGPLGVLGGRGASFRNPVWVAVVNDMPGGPGKSGGGPAKQAESWLKRNLGPAAGFAARNAKTGGALGVTLGASSWLSHKLGLNRLRDLDPQGTRAWDSAHNVLDQLSHGPRTSAEISDARARVRGVANTMRAELHGDVVVPVTVMLPDGKELGRASAVARARRNARRAGG